MSFLLAVYLGIVLICIVLAFALLGSLRAEAPFVPTGRRDMRLILDAAKIVPGETVYDLGSGDGRVVLEAARLGARAVGFEQSRILVWWSRFAAWGVGCARRPVLKKDEWQPPATPLFLLRNSPALRGIALRLLNLIVRINRRLRAGSNSPRGENRGGVRLPSGCHGYAFFIRGDYLKENLGEADVIFCYLLPKAMEHLKAKFETELKPGTRILSRAFKIPGWEPRKRLQFSKHSPLVYVYIK